MAHNKTTPKARILEHLKVLRQNGEELLKFVEAFENYVHHNKVTWDQAGELHQLREMLDPVFRK